MTRSKRLATRTLGQSELCGMAADIFISYKREERSRILPLAQALERDGYTVWWDLELVTGERWATRIKSELDAARAVIVIWTAASVTMDRSYASEWIENEANEAARQNKLVPVLLDDGRIPWTHQHMQYADLVGWRGDVAHSSYLRLREGVERRAGKRSTPASPEVEAWIAAERAQTADEYRRFLATYAHSRFSVLAKARTLELEEAAAWSTLVGTSSERELKVFLEEYPDGRFADEAKKRLSKLRPPKLNASAKQIAAWVGVPTAVLTLLITAASFRDTFFPPSEPQAEIAAPSKESSETSSLAEQARAYGFVSLWGTEDCVSTYTTTVNGSNEFRLTGEGYDAVYRIESHDVSTLSSLGTNVPTLSLVMIKPSAGTIATVRLVETLKKRELEFAPDQEEPFRLTQCSPGTIAP